MSNAFYYDTQIGKIGIVQNGESITHVCFGEIRDLDINIIETPLLKKAYEQIQEYLNEKRKVFDLPLAPQGTDFNKEFGRHCKKFPMVTLIVIKI